MNEELKTLVLNYMASSGCQCCEADCHIQDKNLLMQYFNITEDDIEKKRKEQDDEERRKRREMMDKMEW